MILGLIPGPNVGLIVANSIAHGTRYGLVSVAGTSSAMVPQLAVTVLGASTLLIIMSSTFEWLRWLGVAYLLYLGIKHFLSKTHDIQADKQARTYKDVYWGGFLVSAFNPKTLLFFGAFLPQFISPEGNITLQLIILSVTFLVVITLVDCTWAVLAGRARPYILSFGHLSNKISGAFFIAAGIGLALARKP